MSELSYPERSKQWAKSRGILRTCPIHHRDFDPSIGCRECNKEKKVKIDIFKNVIWPEDYRSKTNDD